MIPQLHKPLMMLLFVRDVWALQVLPDSPSCDPPVRAHAFDTPPDRGFLERTWVREWDAALQSECETLAANDFFDNRFGEGRVNMPSWFAWYEQVVLTWQSTLTSRTRRADWRLARAARMARRRGLRRVIVLPVAGVYTSAPGAAVLVVSQSLFRNDAELARVLHAHPSVA